MVVVLTGISLPEELYDKLKSIREEKGVPISQQISRVLVKHFKKEESVK